MNEKGTGAKAQVPRGAMTLRVVTPCGVAFEAACDSVTLPLADGAGGTGGGSIGIRRGHLPAELALGKGTIAASAGGAPVGCAAIEAGFALVEHNTVTVVTDAVETGPADTAWQKEEL